MRLDGHRTTGLGTDVRRVLILTSIAVFFEATLFFALAPLLGYYEEHLGLSKSGAGLLTAAYGAGVLVCAVPAGYLAVRFGARATVVLGLALLSLGCLGLGFAGSASALEGSRLVQGAGSALAWTGALTWLVAIVPRSRRSEALGIALGAGIAGALTGPAIGAIAARIGTAVTFSSLALIGVVLMGLVLTLRAAPRIPARLGSLVGLLRHGEVVAGTYFLVLTGVLLGALFVLAPVELDDLGWSARAIAAFLLAGALVTALGTPILGRWADRYGTGRLIEAGLGACALASLGLALAHTPVGFALVVVAAEIVFSSTWVPGTTLLSTGTEDAGVSPALGFVLFNLAWSPGFLAGSAGGAALAATTSNAVSYCALSALCVATLIGVLALGHRAWKPFEARRGSLAEPSGAEQE